MTTITDRSVWAEDLQRWHGEVEGIRTGSPQSLIFFSSDRIGAGPRLHRHPYPETFIIRAGRALFTAGGQELVVEAGQIVVVPADTPHKFSNLGPGPLEQLDIHSSDTFITEWLE